MGANLGSSPCDLAEGANSGTNFRDLAERVNSSTNLRYLAERANSSTNLGDLTERANSGTNLGDLAERELVKPISFCKSLGSIFRAPSLVDARVLRNLKVTKADHNLDTTVTEGSLVVIRERYNIPVEYGLHVPRSGQRPYSSNAPRVCILVDVLEAGLRSDGPRRSAWNVEGVRRENPFGSCCGAGSGGRRLPIERSPEDFFQEAGRYAERTDHNPARRHKKVKILSRRNKSRHGEGGSRSHSKGKEPAEPVEESETLGDSAEEDASPIFHRPRSMKDLFKTKVYKDDAGYYALHMSDLAHQDPEIEMQPRWEGLKNSTKVWNDPSPPAKRASELEQELEKTKRERDEALQRLEASDKELNEVWSNLSEIQRLLKEARVKARKIDDELLQSVKALENTRAELSRRAVDHYKESAGFKEGLKRMGRVTYEYDYRVALARFRSLHPDSEVEEDPFTIRLEDDSVPMERQQAFDDSAPPEP
ncbi:hypothetical protein BHE74_00058518 [Ensete ventricosum]|nr:hypothetical protein BHE74_00058518 [Ensete ventricosum]